MKHFTCLLLISLLYTGGVYAHQDFWTYKTFGKVKVRIKTGFNYEEINKAWIIAELANELRKNLQYNDTIFLDFNHYYVGDCRPDYFIAYDKGGIKDKWSDTPPFLNNNALVIREVSRKFNAAITLNLLEYAINNLSGIKQQQKPLKYELNYCNWTINSIDTSLTRKVAIGKPSVKVSEILKRKVYRLATQKQDNDGISYFFQNNKYYIFFNGYNIKDSVLLITDNIYQFTVLSFDKAIVFDTDYTFHYIQGMNKPHASQKYTIKNITDHYQPYKIVEVSADKIAISLWYYFGREGRERTLVYWNTRDQLIQDLDAMLDK